MQKRAAAKRFILTSLIFLVALSAWAVDVDSDPDWLVFEKGKQLYDAGDYGESLYYFRVSRDRFGEIPEVEFWIGRVFEAEGEYELAVRQYLLALDNAEYLDVRDDIYLIYDRLAQIAFNRKNFSEYETQLRRIVERDASLRAAVGELDFDGRLLRRALEDRGADKLLELYRIHDYGGLGAYYRLGVYKLRTGHNERAVELLSYSVVITLTTIIDYLIELDPDYRLSGLPELLEMAKRRKACVEYLESADVFGQIYALAIALQTSGSAPNIETATDLLRITADYNMDGYWGPRAAAQISSPFADDFKIVF